MAYAPGAEATKAPSRPRSSPSKANGRPGPRTKVAAAASAVRRPSVTFLAGLGIGVALGAAAALLLAPHSGAMTRRLIKNRGKKMGNRAHDAWEGLRLELLATRRALRRKRRDAKLDIEAELIEKASV